MTITDAQTIMVTDLPLIQVKKQLNDKALYNKTKHIRKGHNILKKLKFGVRQKKLLKETTELYNELTTYKNNELHYTISDLIKCKKGTIKLYPTIFVLEDEYSVRIVSYTELDFNKLEAVMAQFQAKEPDLFNKYVSLNEPTRVFEEIYGKEGEYNELSVDIFKHKYDILNQEDVDVKNRGYTVKLVISLDLTTLVGKTIYHSINVETDEDIKAHIAKVRITNMQERIKKLLYINYDRISIEDMGAAFSQVFTKLAQDNDFTDTLVKYSLTEDDTKAVLKSKRKKILFDNHPDRVDISELEYMLIRTEVNFIFDYLTKEMKHTKTLIKNSSALKLKKD